MPDFTSGRRAHIRIPSEIERVSSFWIIPSDYYLLRGVVARPFTECMSQLVINVWYRITPPYPSIPNAEFTSGRKTRHELDVEELKNLPDNWRYKSSRIFLTLIVFVNLEYPHISKNSRYMSETLVLNQDFDHTGKCGVHDSFWKYKAIAELAVAALYIPRIRHGGAIYYI